MSNDKNAQYWLIDHANKYKERVRCNPNRTAAQRLRYRWADAVVRAAASAGVTLHEDDSPGTS
ncbi:MAG: hypothetical protein R3288_02940 [Woeseiaceae bacterium]|nr:hypothetical protein [Woeseiaceae bacterium]